MHFFLEVYNSWSWKVYMFKSHVVYVCVRAGVCVSAWVRVHISPSSESCFVVWISMFTPSHSLHIFFCIVLHIPLLGKLRLRKKWVQDSSKKVSSSAKLLLACLILFSFFLLSLHSLIQCVSFFFLRKKDKKPSASIFLSFSHTHTHAMCFLSFKKMTKTLYRFLSPSPSHQIRSSAQN